MKYISGMFGYQLGGVFSRIRSLAVSHLAVLILAVVVGAIYAGPDIYHATTPGYRGVVMLTASDSNFYLSNIHRSYELSKPIGNPFLYEYRDVGNSFQYFLLEFGLGKIGTILHLSIGALMIGMDFFFPALLTLLLYSLAYALSKNKLAAFLAATAMLLGNEIVHPDSVSNLFNTFLFRGQLTESLAYSRPVNPQVSALFLWGTVASLLYLFRNPRSKKAIVLSGVALGALLYVYIFFWAFALALLGVMFLYAPVVRHWRGVIAAVSAGIVSVIVSAPYLLLNWSIILHGGNGLAATAATHHPIIEKMVLLPLFLYGCIYVYAWWSGGAGRLGAWSAAFARRYVFVLLLLCTGVVVSNQQILTGKLLQQEHFHFFTNIPLLLLAMSVLGVEILSFVHRLWRWAAVGGVAVVLVWFSIGVQVSSYRADEAWALRYQSIMPLFNYLNTEAPAESVVLANAEISSQAVMYTEAYVYSSGHDTSFTVPWERLTHDYFVMLALRGVTADSVRAYVYEADHRAEIGGTLFDGTALRDSCGSYTCFPDSVLENLITGYQAFLKTPLLAQLKTYKVDYVLWDSTTDPEWKLSGIVAQPPLVQSGDFKLYSIASH